MKLLSLVSRVTLAKVMFSFNNAPLDSNMLLMTKKIKKIKRRPQIHFLERVFVQSLPKFYYLFILSNRAPAFQSALGSTPDGSWNGTIWSARSAVPPHLS